MFNSKKINDLQRVVSLIRLDLQSMQIELQSINNALDENNINGKPTSIFRKNTCSLIGQKVNAILEFLKLDAKEEHSDSRVVLTKRKTQ